MTHRPCPVVSMRALIVMSAVVLGACGDLEVRSVRAPQAVPQELTGEWVGTWLSAAQTSGAIVVRVQEFAGEPVVRVDFTNPCVAPRSYDLVVTATTIELRAEGEAVMAATLTADRRLVGSYHCPEESGTWSAAWTRDLPELADLGGAYSGTLAVAGQPIRAVTLDVSQQIVAGELQLDGLLGLPDLWPLPVPLIGTAQFSGTSFDLVLYTPAGVAPPLLLTGTGDRVTLQIDNGLLQPIGPQVLPFSFGLVDLVRLP